LLPWPPSHNIISGILAYVRTRSHFEFENGSASKLHACMYVFARIIVAA